MQEERNIKQREKKEEERKREKMTENSWNSRNLGM